MNGTNGSRERDDLGNAQRLCDRHGSDLRWFAAAKTWLCWDGRRWAHDETGEAMRRAKRTARSIFEEGKSHEDSKRRAEFAQFAHVSASRPRLEAMLALAQSEHGITVRADQLDTDPMLLNCRNGTLDLRTGDLREHSRSDKITRLVPLDFDPEAECPRWLRFLGEITDGNPELEQYLQRVTGYALTGSTAERCMFILHGSGANGKTCFTSTLAAMLDDYAGTLPSHALLARRNEDTARSDLAGLRGVRLALASETPENRRLDEATVKLITGGEDRIACRFLYGQFFEFTPACTILLSTNHIPRISGTDEGIWSRLRLIPFTVTIPPAWRDRDLPAKLRKELAGIFAWGVRGAVAWTAQGLLDPECVTRATASFRSDEDLIARFVDDCCDVAPELHCASGDLYGAFKTWADRNGERSISSQSFGRRLSDHDIGQRRITGQRMRTGLALLAGVDAIDAYVSIPGTLP